MAMARLNYLRLLVLGLSVTALFAVLAGAVPYSLSTSKTAQVLPNPPKETVTANGEQTIVLAGGCFWGLEGVFEHLKGVSGVVSGYAGGSERDATYERVSSGQTGHAEAVKITYDPAQITYGQLLKIYFSVAHDPTQLNRQGPDHGTQYRSAIFFGSDSQQQTAQTYIDQLNAAHVFKQTIATQLLPLGQFYPAEQYHQDFITHNPNYPYVVVHDLPKIAQLRQQFLELYKP